MSRLRRCGFTFIELLIASTMMAILFIGLGTYLRGGITVWRRATETSAALQEQRVGFERLERDLANAFIYNPAEPPTDPTAPEFTADHVRWCTIQPSMGGQPARVQIVRYACTSVDGTPGLWRTVQPIAGGVSAKPELMLAGCAGLNMSYAYLPDAETQPMEWQPEWKSEKDQLQLPKLIRIELRLRADSGAERSLARSVIIPSGALKKFPSGAGGP